LTTQPVLPRWQLGVAVVGTLLWMLALVSAGNVKSFGWAESYGFMSGYVLGFIIVFSGFTFWEVVQGRVHRFLDPNPIFRWFSYLMLMFIFLFGSVSLLAEIFGNTTNWAYNIGSLVGSLAVSIGLIPAIEKL
jgi:hypothetical protein